MNSLYNQACENAPCGKKIWFQGGILEPLHNAHLRPLAVLLHPIKYHRSTLHYTTLHYSGVAEWEGVGILIAWYPKVLSHYETKVP